MTQITPKPPHLSMVAVNRAAMMRILMPWAMATPSFFFGSLCFAFSINECIQIKVLMKKTLFLYTSAFSLACCFSLLLLGFVHTTPLLGLMIVLCHVK